MAKIRMVRQTENRTCGPACLAMLAGSTEQKIKRFLVENRLFDGGMTVQQMRKALELLGICHSSWSWKDGLWRMEKKALIDYAYVTNLTKKSPEKCTINLHWLLWANKKYYDPSHGILDELYHFGTAHLWQKVVSYLPIYD
jgi:hypothetical protein